MFHRQLAEREAQALTHCGVYFVKQMFLQDNCVAFIRVGNSDHSYIYVSQNKTLECDTSSGFDTPK